MDGKLVYAIEVTLHNPAIAFADFCLAIFCQGGFSSREMLSAALPKSLLDGPRRQITGHSQLRGIQESKPYLFNVLVAPADGLPEKPHCMYGLYEEACEM